MRKTIRPKVVLCDLDGVVWLAHQPIPGSVRAIASLREAGIRVVFVTNNSFSTYEEQVAALGSMIVYKIWNTNQTLPADFLLGAFSAWLIRTAVAFFKSVEELQNNIDE